MNLFREMHFEECALTQIILYAAIRKSSRQHNDFTFLEYIFVSTRRLFCNVFMESRKNYL